MEKKPSTNNEKGKKPSTSFESSNREDEIKPNIEFSHSEDRKSIYSNQISFPDEEVRPKKDNFKIFGEDYKNFKYFSEDQTRDKFYLEN